MLLSERLEPCGGMDVTSVLAHVNSAERESDCEQILQIEHVRFMVRDLTTPQDDNTIWLLP